MTTKLKRSQERDLDPTEVIAEAEDYLGIRCVPEDQEPEESALISNLYTVAKSLMDPWQPIETAPRDGTELVAILFEDYPSLIAWDTEYGAWRNLNGDRFCMPTHWMHKPKEPR